MAKKIITAALTIAVGILSGVLLAVAGHGGTAVAAPLAQPQSTVTAAQSEQHSSGVEIPAPAADGAASEQPQSGYYVKEYKGRVAVLRSGNDTPEMIFDIHTKMLPELDRQQLADGIYVQSYEEMLRLVEDYIS